MGRFVRREMKDYQTKIDSFLKVFFIFFIGCCCYLTADSQNLPITYSSLRGSWSSTDSIITLKIRNDTLETNEYPWECILSIKGNKLVAKMYYYSYGIFFWRHRDTFSALVLKLTEDTLILKFKQKDWSPSFGNLEKIFVRRE